MCDSIFSYFLLRNRIIQMGRIPIWIYTDIPWIPYSGTDLDIRTYGFVAHRDSVTGANNFTELVSVIANLSLREYTQKLNKVREIRPYFTYDGFFREFDKFLHDPFGPHGGYLRCGPKPTMLGTIVNW